MRKNGFLWCLSALLLAVFGSAPLGIATPEGQVSSQVASRQRVSAPTTSTESDQTIVAQATNPAWPKISLTQYASGLSQPVQITNANDGSGRLFVVQQGGQIRIVKNGVLQSEPFLDITSRVSCCGERGLLGVAFPPKYASKKYFYVNYTDSSGDTVVARYYVTNNPDVANSNKQEVVLKVEQPYANHNGGQLAFGKDGYLYIGMGDGGSSGDPQNNAQNPASLLGKMLRIDVESGTAPYSIPPSNPFKNTPGYRAEIWALGLRNPWRFSFDRKTDDLYIGDVGQNAYEEVNFESSASKGGKNYGWKIMEASQCFESSTCNKKGLTLPIAEYEHSQGCSVTGGTVYRGQNYPNMNGIYFYGDYCSGRLWGLQRSGNAWQNTLFSDTPYSISSFGEDQAGNVYITDYGSGNIYKITSP